MVEETLLYSQYSTLVPTNGLVLMQPELTHNPLFLDAQLTDPALIISAFSQIYEVNIIRTGRDVISDAIHTTRPRRTVPWSGYYRYDPIITVEDDSMSFETFSQDMTTYTSLVLEEDAFKNVEHWEQGQTNVDFTPEFIKSLKKAGPKKLQKLQLDKEGFQIDLEDESIIEKKVELPDNWKIALKYLQKYANPKKAIADLDNLSSFVRGTPYGSFISGGFASIEDGWKSPNNWNFAQINLRSDIGYVIIGATADGFQRLDGRVNPNYDVISKKRQVRQVKSYLLDAKQIGKDSWEVTGSGRLHYVRKVGSNYQCDCGDFVYRHTRCKHIRAVLRPQIKFTEVSGDEWKVDEMKNEKIAATESICFDGMKYFCSCADYRESNLCKHLTEFLKERKDYQFDELVEDFGHERKK